MTSQSKKATIHQVTTLLATSKNVLFAGHSHLLTTGTDDPTLLLSPERQRVKTHQHLCAHKHSHAQTHTANKYITVHRYLNRFSFLTL